MSTWKMIHLAMGFFMIFQSGSLWTTFIVDHVEGQPRNYKNFFWCVSSGLVGIYLIISSSWK